MTLPRPIRIAAFLVALLAVAWGSLTPTEALPTVSLSDKIQHAGAYGMLMLLGAWAFAPLAPVAAGLVLFGVGVEIAQATMHLGRQGDVLDGLANTLGVAVGIAVALALRRRAR